MATEITNLPATIPFKVYKNDSLKKTITITDDDGEPVDLSAAEVNLQVRKKEGSTVLFLMALGDGITVGGDDSNVIFLNKKVTIKTGKYYYDLEITHSNGDVQTIFKGPFEVTGDITRVP